METSTNIRKDHGHSDSKKPVKPSGETNPAPKSASKKAIVKPEKELEKSLGRWNTDGGRNVSGV